MLSRSTMTSGPIPESIWAKKREDIASGIRKLGAGYRQALRDGWVRYLAQKNASGGAGQSSRQVYTGKTERLVVGDDE